MFWKMGLVFGNARKFGIKQIALRGRFKYTARMILKGRDDNRSVIAALERLMADPAIDEATRRKIDQQIGNLRAGAQGEDDAAFQMKVHFGRHPYWIVIHDLRIEHEGLVTQIDHLLINRLLDIWVCESKRFARGININEHGEFSTGGPHHERRGATSPIEQNKRHVKILRAVFESGRINWPRRLGVTRKPKLRSLVLVSNGAIHRPRAWFPGLETVIKTDQLHTRVMDRFKNFNPLALIGMVSDAQMKDVGQQLLALHRPNSAGWRAKYSLAPHSSQTAHPQPLVSSVKRGASCDACQVAVSPGVADYCLANHHRFDDGIYCMACQKVTGANVA